MVDRRNRGAVVVTAGVACSLAGTFLPWLRSGARNRSSYTIIDLVERLGFAPGGAVSWALRLWPVVPLVLVLIAIGAWTVTIRRAGWSVLAVVVGATVAWVGGTAIAVVFAPDVALFRVGPGPSVTLVGLCVVAAGVVWVRLPGSDSSGAA